MILVTGRIVARPETAADIQHLGQAHSARSRAEPGCIAHDLHVAADDPLRFLFVEWWADEASLRAHFAVPESRAFVRALAALVAERPDMRIFRAEAISL